MSSEILVCINTTDHYNITYGKKYDVLEYTPTTPVGWSNNVGIHWIIDDYGQKRGVDRNLFLDISDYRDKKLEELGI